MSDGIAIFRDGRIAQQGSAEDLYERPADGFVADFLGSANLIEGVVARGPQGLHVAVEGQAFRPSADHTLRENDRVRLAIRPERLDLHGAPGAAQGLPARVESVLYLGSDLRVVLRTRGGALLVARAPSRGTALAEGAEVFAAFKPEDAAIVAH